MGIRDRLVSGPLGFGAAPLGNMFRELTDQEAAATVDAAWQHGTRLFDTAPAEITAKVGRIKAIGERHGVPIKAAALHFVLAHPAVVSVIPGASRPERIAEDYAALNTIVPATFWREMRDQHLVSPVAPLPIDR